MIPRLTIVAPQYMGPFSAGLLRQLRLRAGLSARFLAIGDDPEIQASRLRALLQGRSAPQAAIMISIRPDSETVDLYRKRAVPVVLIDEKAPGVASVACDNFSGGYLAGRHLLEKGHHRIALVSGRVLGPGSWNAAQRRDGLRKALSEVAGYPVIQCEAPNYSEQDGAEALHSVVRSEATAVFCAAGDVVAGAMLRIAPDAGISVPKDLAVIGFDDLGTADLIGLTTVRQPLQALSEAAYRMTCINPVETMERPRQIVFPPEIVQRRTT